MREFKYMRYGNARLNDWRASPFARGDSVGGSRSPDDRQMRHHYIFGTVALSPCSWDEVVRRAPERTPATPGRSQRVQ